MGKGPSDREREATRIAAPTNRLYNRLIFAAILVVLALAGVIIASAVISKVTPQDETDRPPRTMTVDLAGTSFTLEVARTEAQRRQGLSDRESLADDAGMLFAFRSSERRTFHMEDCLIPLDIIFLDDQGTVTQIQTLPPPEGSRVPRVTSIQPARYVIEIHGGRAKAIGLSEGDTVNIDAARLAGHVE